MPSFSIRYPIFFEIARPIFNFYIYRKNTSAFGKFAVHIVQYGNIYGQWVFSVLIPPCNISNIGHPNRMPDENPFPATA